ncbi:MAG: sulfotransferase family protein [Minisyncoccales bacterium]
MSKKPDFLVIGAAKSGTSSIHNYLSQHPEISVPKIKETFFLVGDKKKLGDGKGIYGKNIPSSFEDYMKLFKKNRICGEVCTAYLYFYKSTIKNIKKHLGNPKIVIILRNPLERSFSNYLHHVRDNIEFFSFEKALENEKRRKKEGWWWGFQLNEVSLYSKQVKNYLKNFDDVKIILFEDFKDNEKEKMKEIYNFLGADPSFIPDTSIKLNVTGVPTNRFYNLLFNEGLFKRLLRRMLYIIPIKKIEKIKYFASKKLLKNPQFLNKQDKI